MSSIIRKPFKYVYCNAVLILICINVLVFILTRLVPDIASLLSLNVINCLRYKMWWQPVTYMFVHGGFQHIFFNMLGLLFFGVPVERALGTKEFLLIYFLCGIVDGLVSLASYYYFGSWRVFLLGASGALYSILLIYAVFFPKSIIYVFGLIPVPAPLLVLIYAVIEFVSMFSISNVAHFTHLTGFVLAWIYLMVRMGVNPIRVWLDAWKRW